MIKNKLKKVQSQVKEKLEEKEPTGLEAISLHLDKHIKANLDKGHKQSSDELDKKLEAYKGIAKKEFEGMIKNISGGFTSLRSELEAIKSVDIPDIKPLTQKILGIESWVSSYSKQNKIDISFLSEEFSKTVKSIEGRISSLDFPTKLDLTLIDEKYHLLSDEVSLYKRQSEFSLETLEKIIKKLEEDIKKFSKSVYEFGSSFSILLGGITVGQTFGINFIAGTNITLSTAVNMQGFISLTINSSGGGGGGGATFLTATGTVNSVNTAFTFTSAPTILFIDGIPKQKVSSDGTVNWTGTTSVSLTIAPVFDIFGIGGSTILTPTGTVNGSNTSFTFTSAPNIIYVDGVPKQKTSSDGTVNWTGTTSVSLTIAPVFDIFGQ